MFPFGPSAWKEALKQAFHHVGKEFVQCNLTAKFLTDAVITDNLEPGTLRPGPCGTITGQPLYGVVQVQAGQLTRMACQWFHDNVPIPGSASSGMVESGRRYMAYRLPLPSPWTKWPGGTYRVRISLGVQHREATLVHAGSLSDFLNGILNKPVPSFRRTPVITDGFDPVTAEPKPVGVLSKQPLYAIAKIKAPAGTVIRCQWFHDGRELLEGEATHLVKEDLDAAWVRFALTLPARWRTWPCGRYRIEMSFVRGVSSSFTLQVTGE